jgi:hypothetical protein
MVIPMQVIRMAILNRHPGMQILVMIASVCANRRPVGADRRQAGSVMGEFLIRMDNSSANNG